jgi:hypothetical protein
MERVETSDSRAKKSVVKWNEGKIYSPWKVEKRKENREWAND